MRASAPSELSASHASTLLDPSASTSWPRASPKRSGASTATPTVYALPSSSVAELGPWPLAAAVATVRRSSAQVPLRRHSGRKRSDLLSMISGIVAFLRTFQSASGAIKDRDAGRIVQYATPCYALACAVLWSSSSLEEPGLRESCERALTHSIASLRAGRCDSHCAFFPLPIMAAWRILEPHSGELLKLKWRRDLAAVNSTHAYGKPGDMKGNWGELMGAGGRGLPFFPPSSLVKRRSLAFLPAHEPSRTRVFPSPRAFRSHRGSHGRILSHLAYRPLW